MSELKFPKINSITLSARLTRDPELKYTPAGAAVASLSLAFDKSYKKNGEWVNESSFIDAVLWKDAAEKAVGELSKGSPVIVEGKLQTRSYQNKDGINVKITEISAFRVIALAKDSNEQSSGQSSLPNPEDDIPF